MNILVISERLPSRVGGGRSRQFNLIQQLAASHDFTLVSFLYPGDEREVDELRSSLAHLEAIPARLPTLRRHSRLESYWRTWSHAFFDPLPRRGQFAETASMETAVRRLLAMQRFDLVQVHQTYLMRAVPGNSPPVVLDMQDILSEHERRYYQALVRPAQRAAGWIEWRKTQRMERAATKCCAVTTTVSEEDKQKLLSVVPDIPVIVVPNGVDPGYFSPSDSPSHRPTLVFSGSMNYGPNIDAVVWFYRDIFPAIRREWSEASFVVVGYEPSGEVLALGHDTQVQVTGYVEDVRPYLAESAVVIVPLRHGSGTRLKILEAWAMGKAVVSTRLGAEGLQARDGENILLADTAEEFARAVLHLSQNPRLADRIGRTGRDFVERRYGWDAIALQMERAYHAAFHPI